MAREQHAGHDAVRITTASTSRDEEINARQRRYLISMAVRTVCFVVAILVGDGWLRWVLVAAALLLPYVAVVMANAASTRSDGFDLIDSGDGLRQIPARPISDPPTGATPRS